MARTVLGLFDSVLEAELTVRDLLRLGIAAKHISLVLNAKADIHRDLQQSAQTTAIRAQFAKMVDTDIAASMGSETGFARPVRGALHSEGRDSIAQGHLWGGLADLLINLTLLAIPDIGPVVVAGPIAGLLIGGLSGAGLNGSLLRLGIPEDEAALYAAGVLRSGTLVAVTMPERDISPVTIVSVADIMYHQHGLDIRRHDSGDGDVGSPLAGRHAPVREPYVAPLPISLRILAYVNPTQRRTNRVGKDFWQQLSAEAREPVHREDGKAQYDAIDASNQDLLERIAQSCIALERLDADYDSGNRSL